MRIGTMARLPLAFVFALATSILIAGTAVAAEVTLLAELSSANEVVAEGDPDPRELGVTGKAWVVIDDETGEVCWEIESDGINQESGAAAAAHIHVGGPTENGDVVVPLSVNADGSGEGCVMADMAVAQAILDNPPGYYVNVHSTNYPAGVMRGQLMVWEDSATTTPAGAPILPALLLASAALAGLWLGSSALARRGGR